MSVLLFGTFVIMYFLLLSYALSWHLPFTAAHSVLFLRSPPLCLCAFDILSKHKTDHHILVVSLDDIHTVKRSTGSSIWMLQLNRFADAFFGLPSATSRAMPLFRHFSGNRKMCEAARGHKTRSVANSLTLLIALIFYELQQGMQVFLQNNLLKQHNVIRCSWWNQTWS